MAMLSLLLGILSLVGYAFFFWHSGPATIFWSALVLAVAAATLGFIARAQKLGKRGLILGVVCIVIGIVLALWLTIL